MKKKSVDIDSFDFIQQEMINYACKHGSSAILKILFNYGASLILNSNRSEQKTPLEILIDYLKKKNDVSEEHKEVIQLMVNKGSVLILDKLTLDQLCGDNKVLKNIVLSFPLKQFELAEEISKKITELDLTACSLQIVPQCVSKVCF